MWTTREVAETASVFFLCGLVTGLAWWMTFQLCTSLYASLRMHRWERRLARGVRDGTVTSEGSRTVPMSEAGRA